MLHRNLPLKAAAFALAIFLWFWVLLNEENRITGTAAKTAVTARSIGEVASPRTVPVVVRTRGELPDDLRIVSVQLEPPMATVMGAAARVQKVSQIETEPLALERVRGSFTAKLRLVVPAEISLVSDSSVMVRVKVERGAPVAPASKGKPAG